MYIFVCWGDSLQNYFMVFLLLLGLSQLTTLASNPGGVNGSTTTFTVINGCPFTIWPAIVSVSASSVPSRTGFVLQAGASGTVQISSPWTGGFWARTHCGQDSTSGNFSCTVGDCASGKVECTGGRYPITPVTTAGFALRYYNDTDYYDVQLLKGFNLPLLVVPHNGPEKSGISCATASCETDLKAGCPPELQMNTTDGDILGCKSACDVFGEDRYCCTGNYATREACKPSSYSLAYKNQCPDAFTYLYDESGMFTCTNGANYTIHFCPNTSQVLNVSSGTIKPGDQLINPGQLVSRNGNFTLGFFTLKNTNFSYLGIWHTADQQRRKIWVANPNSPILMINNTQVRLVMDSTGNLTILSGQNPINVAHQALTNKNTIAVLQDSGNFLLMDTGAANRTLWQSFDYPTSMLLPGMKLGFNLTTRQNWTLTSWLSSYVAGSGAFTWSLERIQDSGQFVIRRHGMIYWTSGPWENQSFRYMPSLSANSAELGRKLNVISGTDGMYFAFETIGGSLSMLELSPEGQIIDHANSGLPVSPFQVFCYGYEMDNGCATTEFPNCRGKDKFQVKSGYFLKGSSFSYDANSNISLSDCMERCWNNCSCNGFSSNSNGTGCTTWAGNPQFQLDQSGKTEKIYVLDPEKSSKGRAWIWIVVAVSVVVVLLLLGILCYIKSRKRKVEEEEERRGNEYIQQLTHPDSFKRIVEMQNTGREGDLNIFSIDSIMAATDDFSEERKIGEGGFGPVYRGRFPNGREVAVKRLSRTSGQGLVEFKNELLLISKLQHTNLVRVLGCCIHEEEKMLIYEYMPNKSLDVFLFAQDKKRQLDWQKRYNIIEGVAQGLLYLHKYSRMRVIHRDLKASNVLLDENMNSKIADFGMARIFKPNETEAMTNKVVGTYGYMSPEYAMEGTFSIKSDVFSFGVLILEIASGRRNSSFHKFEDRQLNLIGYAWELWKGGAALELKDPELSDSCDVKQLLRSIHVGLLCVQESATDRPTVSEIISMLNNESLTLPAPKQPAFFTGRKALNLGSTSSVNDLTISVIEGR